MKQTNTLLVRVIGNGQDDMIDIATQRIKDLEELYPSLPVENMGNKIWIYFSRKPNKNTLQKIMNLGLKLYDDPTGFLQ